MLAWYVTIFLLLGPVNMHDMGYCNLQYRALRQSLQEQVNVPRRVGSISSHLTFRALYVNEASSGYLLRYLTGMKLITFWSKEIVRLIYPWGDMLLQSIK